MLRGRKRHPN